MAKSLLLDVTALDFEYESEHEICAEIKLNSEQSSRINSAREAFETILKSEPQLRELRFFLSSGVSPSYMWMDELKVVGPVEAYDHVLVVCGGGVYWKSRMRENTIALETRMVPFESVLGDTPSGVRAAQTPTTP